MGKMGFPLSAANSCRTRCHQVSRNTFSVSAASSSTPAPVTGFKYSKWPGDCYLPLTAGRSSSVSNSRAEVQEQISETGAADSSAPQFWWGDGESLLIQVVMHVCDKRGWCYHLGNVLYTANSSTHGSKAGKGNSGTLNSQYSHFSFHDLLKTSNLQPSCAQW